jgi:transcriptional regulator with PAS, ATPase and Fis domain
MPINIAQAQGFALESFSRILTMDAQMAESWRQLLVGSSPAIEEVAARIRLAGPRRSTILILGETGTGKEVTAKAIHAASPRSTGPMVSINCSALPENLLEAELFGHVRGAFTGAVNHRAGRFELAHGGTIFLDEIGDMPLDLQAKLLRVLQEREIQRLGSSETVPVDVRVIAATNAPLEDRIASGQFREDLYYRLNVVPIHLPALRDRAGDVAQLARHFVEKVCRLEKIAIREIAPETIAYLESFSWPGNVRQLENAVEMAIALGGDRLLLLPEDFPLARQPLRTASAKSDPHWIPLPEQGLDLQRTLGAIELNLLRQALARANGNKQRAADILQLNRTTLNAKLKSLTATATG